MDKKIKIKECQRTLIINTDILPEMYPESEKEIPVIMSGDNNYAPYLAVSIKSLIENTTPNNNYCIYVLHTEISEVTQKRILKLETSNCKIKFVDVSAYLAEYDDSIFHVNTHFSVATYFRFFIPQLFKNFEKVVYCDCDAVFLDDVANLFNIDIGDNWLGAARDTYVNYLSLSVASNTEMLYYKNVLGLKEPKNYFQAGILIMNIPELIKANFTMLCIETLKRIKTPKFVDQCIMNIVCEDKAFFINEEWNLMYSMYNFVPDFQDHLPDDVKQRFSQARKNPKYLHYCGQLKPWKLPFLESSEYFWKYAKMTDYYEQIIYDNAHKYQANCLLYNQQSTFNLNFWQNIFSMKNFLKNKKKYKIITILGIRIKFSRSSK